MIARIWRGATRAEDGADYVEYLEATGLREYRDAPGNRGVLALRRQEGGRAEFLLLTLWDSMDAVRGFAGDDPERAVFYPEDDRFLVERGERVEHYEVVRQTAEAL
jgi:heme-degrading monooxygenase HmoA